MKRKQFVFAGIFLALANSVGAVLAHATSLQIYITLDLFESISFLLIMLPAVFTLVLGAISLIMIFGPTDEVSFKKVRKYLFIIFVVHLLQLIGITIVFILNALKTDNKYYDLIAYYFHENIYRIVTLFFIGGASLASYKIQNDPLIIKNNNNIDNLL